MIILILIALSACLFWMAYQDLNERKILLVSFGLLLVISAGYQINQTPILNELWQQIVFNIAFLVVQLLIVHVFYWIKLKRFAILIGEQLGAGDVLFLFISTLLFPTPFFILFYISGLIIAFIAHKLVNSWDNTEGIPLVGVLAIHCMVMLIGKHLINAA